ncbi:MAG: hypothetical protein OFPI_44050 [Osedax symbiont Rs2]|nr:MAG: hypothetical protein OFPI_44050 [Osedax symbiont Rs2]
MKFNISVLLLGLCVFNQQAVFAGDKNTTELTVHINSASSDKGVVRVFLLNTKEQFDQLEGHYKTCTKAVKSRRVSCRFENIPYADYVIFGFHDENSDTQLNFSLLGSPLEKMGISNIDLADNDDPTFAQSKFKLGSVSAQIFMNLQ